MFLHLLSKIENESFIELVGIAKQMNGNVANSECANKNTLRSEHSLPLNDSQYQLQLAIIGRLKNSSIHAKRTIILELASLFYREKSMNDDLSRWLRFLGCSMDVNEHQTDKLLEWSKDFNEFIDIGYMYINSK